MIYWTAVSTAYRQNELRSLKRANFYLDEQPPSIALKAHKAKNRRDGDVPLAGELAAALFDHLGVLHPTAMAFWFPSSARNIVEMLRRDLRGAEIEEKNDHGLIDFHSLRHTAITWWLDEHELNPRRVATLARLGNLELVMRYSRRFRLEDTDWLDRTPVMSQKRDAAQGAG